MQHEVQTTRRSFLTRLSVLAGGAIALGAAGGFLTGCGGGGGSGTGVRPPSGGGTTPGLPALTTITPLTPQQAATSFQNTFGIPTVVGAQQGTPIQNVPQRVAAAFTLDNLIIPKFTLGANGAPTAVTLQTARQAGYTQAKLNTFIQTLINAKETVVQTDTKGVQHFVSLPLVRVGDRIFQLTFTFGGKTINTIVLQHADGTLGFNSVLFAVPGAAELRQTPATDTNKFPNDTRVVSVITNRNPYDGHVHYEFTLAAHAVFDALTGAVTLSNGQAVVDQLGPFVQLLNGPTAPTVTQTSASVAVRAQKPKHCQTVESDGRFSYDYDNDGNSDRGQDDSWDRTEHNKEKVCDKTETGSTGGSGG